jgi:hypothetical protein
VDATDDRPGEGERARIRALEALGIRPDERHERFDRLTRLATALFEVPMATISLLDENRQWFASAQGLEQASIPRPLSYCDRTVRDGAELVLEDVAADPRYAGHPALTELGIRFYAGEPLRSAGQVVGTLCLLGEAPRAFTPHQRELLRDIAAAAEQELHRADELARAAEVQRTLVPRTPPSAPGWEFAAAYRPARSVGGDFLDWRRQDPDRLVLTVADVMGKGVPAALLAASVRTALRTATRDADPAAALHAAAAAVDDDLQRAGALVTALHARLDTRTGALEWVDAGHGLQLVLRADGRTEHRAGAGGLPLGVLPGDSWTPQRLVLEPGDVLLAFSDGLLDLFDGTLAALGPIVELARRDGGGAVAAVERFVALTTGRTLPDDVTVLAAHRLPR